MAPRALLFDLDGTLVDSDPIHLGAWQEMLRPYGIAVDEAEYRRRISGRINPAIVADYLPQLSVDEARAFAARKEAMFREGASHLEPVPGLRELIERARSRGTRLALVTNAPVENVDHMLRVLRLDGMFEVVVLADRLARGKPDPLPYATALERLELAARDGFAFEDSLSGVRSARAAGLRVAGITTTQPAAVLVEAGADPIVADFTDATLLRLD